MKVYIFGLGERKKYLDRCLRKAVTVSGYIDNYKANNMSSLAGKPVMKQGGLCGSYDYIIITLLDYESVKDSLVQEGIPSEKIISFFDFADASNEKYWNVINPYKWRTELIWKHYTEITIPTIDNLNYELYANSTDMKKICPEIVDAQSTVRILAHERKCLARFGDNEFELMLGRLRTDYQDVDFRLAGRLREVLASDEDNLLVAIADNYGSLEKYTDRAARDIRMYMTKEVRESHMRLLDLNRTYYDAYLSRPYMIYRDKTSSKEKFDQVKALWKDEEVLIVEGEYTRFGVGNDLLDNARRVERIIAPAKNAFDQYQKIKDKVCMHGKNKLILAILGPTATVLSYDLAREGYWILDIGQIDIEYGWFLLGVKERCALKYKRVSEIVSYEMVETDREDENIKTYMSQVMDYVL